MPIAIIQHSRVAGCSIHLHVSTTAVCHQSNNTYCIQSLKLLIQNFQKSNFIQASVEPELNEDFGIPVTADN